MTRAYAVPAHDPVPALDGTPGVCRCGLPLAARNARHAPVTAAAQAEHLRRVGDDSLADDRPTWTPPPPTGPRVLDRSRPREATCTPAAPAARRAPNGTPPVLST